MSLGFYAICIVVAGTLIHINEQRRVRDEQERQRQRRDEQRDEQQRQRQRQDGQRDEQQRQRRDMQRDEQQRRLNEAAMELENDIDFYIRSRKQFDSRSPLKYCCDIGSVVQDAKVTESLDYFNFLLVSEHEMSLREFVTNNGRFVLENNNRIGVRTLTPFQGKMTHRVYGYLSCISCKRDWQSAATYANKWQKCQICEARCYPYNQHILERSGDEDNDNNRRPHDTRRCQRCLELGRICLPNRYYAM